MYDALAARDIDCKLTPSSDFNDIAGFQGKIPYIYFQIHIL